MTEQELRELGASIDTPEFAEAMIGQAVTLELLVTRLMEANEGFQKRTQPPPQLRTGCREEGATD